MIMKKILLGIFSIIVTSVSAQQMGSLKDYKVDGAAVTMNCEKGQIVIQQYADCGWKVTTLPTGKTMADERPSITLTGEKRGELNITVENGSDELIVSAGASSVIVNKATSLLSFRDNGTVRLREKTCLDNTSGATTVSFEPQNDAGFYGGGYNGRWGNLDGKTLRMNNTQNYNWDQSVTNPNNICVPFIVSSNGYGILFEDHYIDAVIKPSATEGTSYNTKSPTPISYVYVGSEDGSLSGVMKTYADLTGKHELPPYWALGYITSRYGYHTQKETQDVIAALEEAGMPVSGVVLDLFWEGEAQDGMGNLDWYKPNWPDAPAMLADFKARGVHTIIITEPYFAEESANYKPLLDLGLFADPECPGMDWVSNSHVGIIDFMNPKAIDWYWNFYRARTNEGVDGWWLDLGEPEMITEGTIHADGSTHMQAHNEFSMKWFSGLWKKWKQEYPNKRPIFLPRAGTSGMQRYATFPWTGDISRSWSGLKCQVPTLINGGMSGLGYLSSDIGGFVADYDPSGMVVNPDLYLRWFQLGVFSPVMRTHSQYLPEPYQPEYKEHRERLSNLLALRYQLLPYIYSSSWKNASQGTPITAPANFYTEESRDVANLDNEYLFGPNILVAPITEQGAKGRNVLLPSGEWIDLYTQENFKGNQTISFSADDLHMPVFLRRGTFTPMYGQEKFSTMEKIDRSKMNIVYTMAKGKAWDFTLYDDDHESAQTGNRYELITFSGEDAANGHVITITQQCAENYEGRPASREMVFTVMLNKGQKVSSVTSTDLSIANVEYSEKLNTLKFRATVPSSTDRQDSITITFDTTGIKNATKVKSKSRSKKFLLNNSQIVIESNGNKYKANGAEF